VLKGSEPDLLGCDWFAEFVVTSELEQLRAIYAQLIIGHLDAGAEVDHRIRTRDGEVRHIHWRNSLVRDSGGGIIGTLSSGEDVTERLRAEARFQQNNEIYQTILDHLDAVVYVARMDTFELLFVNR